MRIVHQSSDLLSVAEPAVGVRTCGGVFAALGAVLLGTGLRTGSVTAGIIGTISFTIGAALVLLPSITVFHFNRGEKRLVVARRRLWQPRLGGGYEEYPLRDVIAAQVDESSSDDGSTWRVIVRLMDGRTIPFTSYYASGLESKRDMANRISRFLELPQGTQSFAGAPSPHTIVRQGRKGIVVVAIMFTVVGAVFGSFGGVTLVREYRRLAQWLPVQATVTQKRVDVHYDSDGSTYRPVVVYRYWVDDREYTSSRTLPINEGRGGRWAYRVVARFTVGGTYTAWYDPAKPSDAFIVRSHSIIAPVFTLIGVFAVVGGCAIGVSALRNRES